MYQFVGSSEHSELGVQVYNPLEPLRACVFDWELRDTDLQMLLGLVKLEQVTTIVLTNEIIENNLLAAMPFQHLVISLSTNIGHACTLQDLDQVLHHVSVPQHFVKHHLQVGKQDTATTLVFLHIGVLVIETDHKTPVDDSDALLPELFAGL